LHPAEPQFAHIRTHRFCWDLLRKTHHWAKRRFALRSTCCNRMRRFSEKWCARRTSRRAAVASQPARCTRPVVGRMMHRALRSARASRDRCKRTNDAFLAPFRMTYRMRSPRLSVPKS
jgi:hypothetical protein